MQPYGVIVPAKYDRARPMRLDVVLHGSSRPVGMSELRFMGRFDEGDDPAADAPDRDYIELHPLGRVENGYRWAGETDVFEAIEAVCRNYAIDRDRIVLRGMSMGASGTWHLGLKHPDRFVALGPYCGYVDTHEFSKTPLPNFVKVGPLPPHQEKTLHMLDSVDYAANAGVVPAIACMGEKDVFFQAHVLMGRAMAKEGLAMVNLISPGTGHVIDPVTHAEQMRRIGEYRGEGAGPLARAHPLRHLDAEVQPLPLAPGPGAGGALRPRRAGGAGRRRRHGRGGGAEERHALCHPAARGRGREDASGSAARPSRCRQRRGEAGTSQASSSASETAGGPTWASSTACNWTASGRGCRGRSTTPSRRRSSASAAPGTAWNPAVQAWAEASLKRFAYEWSRYFRGELPVKDDTAVTAGGRPPLQPDPLRRPRQQLAGSPGCSRGCRSAGRARSARSATRRSPRPTTRRCLIQPNPLAAGRYVVLNSGHTFHEKELATLNYLLFPRLGDWAVVKVPDDPSPADRGRRWSAPASSTSSGASQRPRMAAWGSTRDLLRSSAHPPGTPTIWATSARRSSSWTAARSGR